MDSRSFIDNRDSIAEAVRRAVIEGNPMVEDLRRQILPM
jgi:hypothetical protein